MSILLVEDSPADRYIAKHVIKRTYPDAEVTEAHDGLEALEFLETKPTFDLILLDLNMPRMGGLEFLEAWAQRAAATPPSVVVLTSSDQAPDREAALSFSAVAAFLVKPLTKTSAATLSKYLVK